MLGHVLHVDAVGLETAIGPHLLVLVAVPLGEAKLLADEDLLPAGELELAPPQGLDNLVLKECVKKMSENLQLCHPHYPKHSEHFLINSHQHIQHKVSQ